MIAVLAMVMTTAGACAESLPDLTATISDGLDELVPWSEVRYRRGKESGMRFKTVLTAAIIVAAGAIVLMPSALAAEQPSFEQFPAGSIYSGRTAFPKFNGRDKAFQAFKTRIQNGLEGPPNFASEFSGIQFGCGSSCTMALFTSKRTGKVVAFPRGGEENLVMQLKFRPTSRLVVTQWGDMENCFKEYFEWRGGTFRQLGRDTIGPFDVCLTTHLGTEGQTIETVDPELEDVVLFSGGFKDVSGDAWANRIGSFGPDRSEGASSVIKLNEPQCTRPSQPGRPCPLVHAEAQRIGAIGADFLYSANVTVIQDADVHLQFRIADEGRYGVRLTTAGIALYNFHLPPLDPRVPTPDGRPKPRCSDTVPSAITHCPNWQEPDLSDFHIMISDNRELASGSTHRIAVLARGSLFDVLLDDVPVFENVSSTSFGDLSTDFRVGRFGIYAFGKSEALKHVRFSDVRAVANPLAASNFALLYSTVGYEARGTKRALVRTLNDVPDSVRFDTSQFVVTRSDGIVVKSGALKRLNGKTFGMQLWEADFSSITGQGTYTLKADIAVPGRDRITTLQSAPFEIRSKLVSTRLLKSMSLVNAEVRRGSDEDFWRNWTRESGTWRVGVDGAFIADRADTGAGATITRVFNINNESLENLVRNDPRLREDFRFRFVGRVTIVSGCDAQMRFEDINRNWWAVTLQAGVGGGCPFDSGPGAIRLSQEGPSVPGGFAARVTKPLRVPFEAGHPYQIEILVKGTSVNVFVDQPQGEESNPILSFNELPARSGRFGLKAWRSTARFEDVQAWKDSVKFARLDPGRTRIPTFLNRLNERVACQHAPLECRTAEGNLVDDQKECRTPSDESEKHNACNPIFSQIHGFHDSSSNVAEATSHGSFLRGLMQIWKSRAAGFAQEEREELRRAIVTNALYIDMLFEGGGRSGQFAHSEMGRVGVDENLGLHQTEAALIGESDFADAGTFVDRALARKACQNARASAEWRWPTETHIDPFLGSVVFAHLARCSAREGFPDKTERWNNKSYWQLAFDAAENVLMRLHSPTGIQDADRDTGRFVPWFEGIYEIVQSHPQKLESYSKRLNHIASTLVTHLTQEHQCDESVVDESRCPANGFYALPQASGGFGRVNWVDMQRVPKATRPAALLFVHWYNVQGHFPISAIDMVLLARMTGNSSLERVASANLYWPLGLNPGIPRTKIIGNDGSGSAWGASSFIYRLGAPFGQAHRGYRIESYTSKGWLDPWEDSEKFPGGGSPNREAWRIDPQNGFADPPVRSFLSLMNGHVLWDEQWDYWNTGKPGWSSGETFILGDGLFLKAALLLEDWLTRDTVERANPYDTTRLAFFDTTHVDRFGAPPWGFDDPDRSSFAHASRTVHEFCRGKGFPAGRFTGHYLDERVGALCVAETARFFDATDTEVSATGWNFVDINTTEWAQVSRAATGFCGLQGFVGGFFTGHQLNGRRGIVCLASDSATFFDATDQEILASVEGFSDINTVHWAKASRAATNSCLAKGFGGGFFTGHQVPGRRGLVCLAM